MPANLAARSQRTAIELDTLSAKIAKQLYQRANVVNNEYQSVLFPENFFDVAVGNVPFANITIFDPNSKDLTKLKLSLHDYYFAKSLSQVRPGGIVAFITSRYTMDKVNGKMRDYVASKADLLGAIRLPNTQFKDIANTDVTTDILVFQRREDNAPAGGESWAKTEQMRLGEETVTVNEYFVRHPEQIMGTLSTKGTMYSRNEVTVENDGRDMSRSLDDAFRRLPQNAMKPRKAPASVTPRGMLEALEATDDVKEGAYTIQNNALYIRRGAQFVPVEDAGPTVVERAKGLIGLREQVREVFRTQLAGDDQTAIKQARQELNKRYDKFVKKWGPIHAEGNRRLFRGDPDYPTLQALEKWDKPTKTAKKADIFSKRVIEYRPKATKVETAKEAMLVSMNDTGRIDIDRMVELTGKKPADLFNELKGIVFKNPEHANEWEPADSYLSGNVRKKLRVAREAAKLDPSFQPNVEALETVQPKDLEPTQIHVKLGHGWIPTDIYAGFINHLFDVEGSDVTYNAAVGAFAIKATVGFNNAKNDTEWGTSRAPAISILEDALHSQLPTVYDRTSDDKRIVNQKETLAAREKLEKMQAEFTKWLWSDSERSQRLARIYNDEYNAVRLQDFDGSHLTLPGANPLIKLRPHQKNGIWRALQAGNTLLGHVVGAGKTFTMVGIAMEARRLRMANKPMYVVPNHLTEYWGKAILQLYPAAKVLVPTKADFKKENRRKLLSRVATGDWDGVVIAHSQLAKLPISLEAFKKFVDEQVKILEEYIREIKDQKGGNKSQRNIVKELEKAKKRLEAKLKAREAAVKEKADQAVTFEESGVDMLLVDEADLFKNLFFPTRMTRVAGLPNTEAHRSYDLLLKTNYLNSLTGQRGVHFGTGTPISNSMAEVFTMQRYLQPKQLEEAGLQHFDSWARQFGNVVVSMELAPDGSGYRPRTRFAEFVNVPELTQLFRQVMDVKLADELKLPVPKLKTGAAINTTSPPSPALRVYTKELIDRAAEIRSGGVDPRNDNMLKVTNDGRMAALDVRLRVPGAPEDKTGKVAKAVGNVLDNYKRSTPYKGTQLIFLDLSIPKGEGKAKEAPAAIDEDTEETQNEEVELAEEAALRGSVYQDIKRKLVKGGMPEKEIAYIHDAKTEAQKEQLFADVNAGKIRVLLGSTEKMGAGTNVQQRLVALHSIDAPWRPRDLEQREGRIIRQGNLLHEFKEFLASGKPMSELPAELADLAQHTELLKNFEIEVHRYATEAPSFDVYMWQTLELKAKTIAQIMRGDPNLRTIQDVDTAVMSYAEMKAIASGNPMIMERVKVETELNKLSALASFYVTERRKMEGEIKTGIPYSIEREQRDIQHLDQLKEVRDAHPAEPFTITLDGVKYTDEEAAGKAAVDLALVMLGNAGKDASRSEATIGTYRGTIVKMETWTYGKTFYLFLKHPSNPMYVRTTEMETTVTPAGVVERLNNALDRIERITEDHGDELVKLQKRRVELKAQLEKPFEHDERIKWLEARLAEIDKALDLSKKDEGVISTTEEAPPKKDDGDEGQQAAGGEDQPSFEQTIPHDDRGATYADFRRAMSTALPIGGKDMVRLVDSSNQYSRDLMERLANRPYVGRLAEVSGQVFNEMKRVLGHPEMKSARLLGFSPDDFYLGVNMQGAKLYPGHNVPDVILLNPWTIALKIQKAIDRGYMTEAQSERETARQMLNTILHELTHQQVDTNHEDEERHRFELQLAANYAKIPTALYRETIARIERALKGADDAATRPYEELLTDLEAIKPFWRDRTRLSGEARRRDAVSRRAGNGQDVAGEGASGRTGPPRTVRSGRSNQTSSVGAGPSFQRRDTDERVAPPQYLQEAQNYRLQRLAEERGFTSSDPDIEARVRAAKQGIKPDSLGTRLKDNLAHVWRLVSREFEHLPDTAQFSPLRTDLLRLQKYKGIAADQVQRELAAIVKPLDRKQYDQLEWKALLSDLKREGEQERALPFGYTPEKVQEDLDQLNEAIAQDPKVQEAWNRRQRLWDRLKTDYQRSMDAIGFDVSKKLTKEDYFRHQVLEYSKEKALKGTGSRVRTPTGRGFLKSRQGSTMDINANYVQAEFEVMAQMVYDTQVAKVIHGVDKRYNIRRDLEQEAKAQNNDNLQGIIDLGGLQGALVEGALKDFRKRIGMHMGGIREALDLDKGDRLTMEQIAEYAGDVESPANLPARGVMKAISERKAFIKETLGRAFVTWDQLIPETHDLWQPREGNVFYMADSIPAQMAKALQEGMLEESGLSPDKLRTVLAMGNKREQYVIPKEAKATLDDLSHKEHSWFVEANRQLLGHWKQLMLIAPRKVLRYNLRNLTGDMDAMFVGNPSAFTKLPAASKDLVPVIFNDKPLTGEAKEWAQRGGYGTTLQMQELGELNDLEAFKATLEKESKGGWLKAPATLWNTYWKAARLSTDYREAIGRYAAYLDYLEQMRANNGRPKNFGASKPETVMALQDVRDRAFKLSNELLGAYDRVSVAGQTIRSFWIPFWSWQEVNATRYAQLMKNALDGEGKGATVRGAAIGTKNAAAFLIKASMLWAMLQAWNYLNYGDDEDELRDTNPAVANRPHILFGRDEKGKIQYLAGIGALGDLLAWFGLDEFPGLVGDLMHDRMTIGEAIKRAAKAPVNKVLGGLTPTVKLPAELLTRQSFYPDAFNPRPIQDRGDYLGNQTTFGPEIQALRNKPGKPLYGTEDVTGLLIQRTDPKAAAYSTWQGIEKKYLERMGKESSSVFWRSERGQALSNWSRAIADQDQKAEQIWKAEYERIEREKYGHKFSHTQMWKDIEKSLRAKAPLAGVTKTERDSIVKGLDSQEKRTLQKAEAYYKDTLLQVLPLAQRRHFEQKLERQGWIQREPMGLTPDMMVP